MEGGRRAAGSHNESGEGENNERFVLNFFSKTLFFQMLIHFNYELKNVQKLRIEMKKGDQGEDEQREHGASNHLCIRSSGSGGEGGHLDDIIFKKFH